MLADELRQPARFVKLVDAVAHLLRAGPELLGERRGQAEVGVEDVQGASLAVAHAQVGADAGLLAVLEAPDVVVGDPVRRDRVVVLDAQPRHVHDDGEAHAGERRVADEGSVRLEIERLVRKGAPRLVEGALQLGHERLELRLRGMRAPEGQGGAQGPGLHLLQADDVRQRLERGDAARDAALARPRGGQAPQGMAEVADVVAEDAERTGHRRAEPDLNPAADGDGCQRDSRAAVR